MGETPATVSERVLEADEFRCVICGAVAREHPKDGLGECPECVETTESETT